MNWTTQYLAKRNLYWPMVEQFFGRLSPRLFRQGVLLQNNLATFYADTGQFKDILTRERDHPLLYLHFWLLDDWEYPANPTRNNLEQHLFLAMFFCFAAVYIYESILDTNTNVDNSFLFLERALTQQSDFHLAQLFPGSSPFWTYQQSFWQESAEADLAVEHVAFLWTPTQPARRTTSSLPEWPNLPPLPHPLAFTKIPAAAVAIDVGKENLLPQLEALLNQFNEVYQCMREITTLRRDLAQHHYTYPILKTLQAAGLNPLLSLSPEQILGAMALTGSIAGLCRENLAKLEACRSGAQALHLPSFVAYLTGIEVWVSEVEELFSIKRKSSGVRATPLKPQKPLFAPHMDTLPKVIEMAEGYLLSDLTFRESWEVQRRGLFGLPEMTGQAFPMGLAVEILCRHGHDMTGSIDEIFSILQATGFRYYDHPHLPPDTDDLGLLLRLYPYSAQPERHRDILQTPLRWLENSLSETGEIPVWLNIPQDVESQVEYSRRETKRYPFLALWGQSCTTVEANVLLGLMAYKGEGYRSLIQKSARQWGERVTVKGLNASHHYVSLYALWVGLELINQLKLEGYGLEKVDQAAQTLQKRLALEAHRSSLSPQDVAFLTLADLSLRNQKTSKAVKNLEIYLPDWMTFLCKTQRYDGSWAGEPLFGTPTRGELAAWYSSRTVTTAFCYHALKSYLLLSAR